MKIIDFVIIGVLLLWFFVAVRYLYHWKKQGRCIGCKGCLGSEEGRKTCENKRKKY